MDIESVKILLEVSQRRVTEQITLTNALDTKAGIIMASTVLIAERLVHSKGFVEDILPLVLLGMSFILGLIGFMVISLRQDPNPAIFVQNYLNEDELKVRLQLIANLNDSYIFNERRLRLKARAIQIAIILLVFVVFYWISSFILT